MSELASTFAKTGQPSYAGITNETYVGAERREPGVVTLKGDWHTDRQYVELKKGSGDIVVPFVAGEVNLVMQPGPSGRAAVTVLLDGKAVGDARMCSPSVPEECTSPDVASVCLIGSEVIKLQEMRLGRFA